MWLVVTDCSRGEKTLFLVNRNIIKNKWWALDINEARVFRVKKAADNYANKLKFRNPRVVTLNQGRKIARDMAQYKMNFEES